MGTGTLTDKGTVVTGAAGEIGRATAAAFAREGARVALVDLDGDALSALSEQLDASTGRGAGDFPTYVADVADRDAVDAYLADAAERFGGLDVLHNNAAVEGAIAPLAEYDDDVFDRVMRVNVRGVWLNLKRAVPLMTAAGGGSIVNTASGAALRGLPYMGAYVASKHAVLGLTRTAAVELAASGIRVNCVCPGPIDTRMMRSLEGQLEGRGADPAGPAAAGARALYESTIPMGRYGLPGEVAEAVTFLASSRASFVTGAAMTVDGGGSVT